MSRNAHDQADLMLVCSSGGHLQQMLALKPVWERYEHVWVTFDKSDTRSLLSEERVVYAHSPTNRNVRSPRTIIATPTNPSTSRAAMRTSDRPPFRSGSGRSLIADKNVMR